MPKFKNITVCFVVFFAESVSTIENTKTQKISTVTNKGEKFLNNIRFCMCVKVCACFIKKIIKRTISTTNCTDIIFFSVSEETTKAAKPVSPFAKFRQLDRQNSSQSSPK